MSQPRFTLVVAATEDGFIARHPGHNPADWASPEEQALFFDKVDACDWGIMGRGTHETADKPHRRRIVFSTSAPTPDWRRPTQLWVDPAKMTPADFPALVGARHPMQTALILGGTTVHDWFLGHGAIDEVLLTVEPCRFGAGLPIFSDQAEPHAESVIAAKGFDLAEDTRLNAAGTRLLRWRAKG